jgi:tetratricopeptide (TPR) repeat protein
MAEERLHRRLAAILSADVVGYSRLMSIDEAGTLARLRGLRRDLIDPEIAACSCRIVKLMGKLTEGEQARLHYTTTRNIEAWTYWVQGQSEFRQAPNKEQNRRMRSYWEKALALDPHSAALNAMLGFAHYADARYSLWDNRETALAKARSYVERALELDPENSDAYTTSSLVYLLHGRHDEAVADARRAIELAAGSADAAAFASFVFASSGYADEAKKSDRKGDGTQSQLSPVLFGSSWQRLSPVRKNRGGDCLAKSL